MLRLTAVLFAYGRMRRIGEALREFVALIPVTYRIPVSVVCQFVRNRGPRADYSFELRGKTILFSLHDSRVVDPSLTMRKIRTIIGKCWRRGGIFLRPCYTLYTRAGVSFFVAHRCNFHLASRRWGNKLTRGGRLKAFSIFQTY